MATINDFQLNGLLLFFARCGEEGKTSKTQRLKALILARQHRLWQVYSKFALFRGYYDEIPGQIELDCFCVHWLVFVVTLTANCIIYNSLASITEPSFLTHLFQQRCGH